MPPERTTPRAGWRITISGRIALYFGAVLVSGWFATLYVELQGLPFAETEGWIEHIRRADFQQLSAEAEGRRLHIEEWIKERRNDVDLFAASFPPAILSNSSARQSTLRPAEAAKAVEWLLARKGKYSMIDDLLLLAPTTGALLASSDESMRIGGRPLPNGMIAALRVDGVDEVLDVQIDSRSNHPQLLIARKVFIPGQAKVLAYIAAIVDLEEEIKGRGETQLIDFLGATAEINLYDQGGYFVTKPRFGAADGSELYPLRSLDRSKLPTLAIQGGEGHLLTRDYRDINVLAAYRYVRITPEIGWGLVIKKDEAETLAAIRRHADAFVLMTAIGLLCVILASLLLSRHVTQPIRQIVGAARAISAGNWRARADVAGRSEIAELAVTFNDMATRLAAWHDELAEQVRLKTEQIRAEEGKLTSFSETTVDGMIIIDDTGAITFWNPAAERIFGYDKSEALGRDVHQLLTPTYLRTKATGAFRDYVATGSGSIINTMRELPALTKAGQLITVELVVSSLVQNGRRFAIGTLRDVTARKRTESALRLVAEQLSVKVGDEYFRTLATTLADLVHADYVIVAELDAATPGMATTVGVRTPRGVVDNFTYPLADSPCEEVLGNRSGLYPRQLQALFPKDRTLVDMAANAYAGVPLSDKDGKAIGLIAALWKKELLDGDDVHTYLKIFAARAGSELERLRAERALARHLENLEARVAERTEELSRSNQELAQALKVLNKAQTELVEAEKLASLGSLVAGIAHELNTPIGNSVMVSTTLSEKIAAFRADMAQGALKRSTLDNFLDDVDHGSRLIASGLHRSAELIHDFKQVAVDQTSSQRRRFDLRRTIEEVVAVMHPRLKKSTHQVTVTVPDGIELDSYPGPLGQVLTNLIQNALIHAFGERSGGIIAVQAESNSAATVRIIVRDDGCGMPEDVLSHVFEPFFTTRLGLGGSGLGMNITYNLVTGVLGGRIALSSAVGTGTTVRIELPLVAPTTRDDSTPPQNKDRQQ